MWCIYCGHEWVGKSMYCPKCKLPAEVAPVGGRKKMRPERAAELIVVVAATAIILWLVGRA